MKDSNLILGSKETLTKEQMRKINGGICHLRCDPWGIGPYMDVVECSNTIIFDICQTTVVDCMC